MTQHQLPGQFVNEGRKKLLSKANIYKQNNQNQYKTIFCMITLCDFGIYFYPSEPRYCRSLKS